MKTAYIFLPEGFEETEAVTTVDVLRRGGVEARTVSFTEELAVTGSHGITVMADETFSRAEAGQADMLILPGGPGHKRYEAHEQLLAMLRAHHERGGLLAAICAAPVIFGGLGLLKGREAACYPGFEPRLEGANVTGGAVAVSGNIVTSRGPGTAAPFAFALLALLAGDETARRVEKEFIWE